MDEFVLCAGYVSQRWVMAVMGMLGVTMAYVMRACLGITLTQMVRPVVVVEDQSRAAVHHDYCPMPKPSRADRHNDTSASSSNRTGGGTDPYRDRFDWDEETQGQVLSAFYYGYIITHLPGGVLSQKFGGKHTMGFGILSTALFTLMTPFVAYMGSTQLTILRFVEGLGEVLRGCKAQIYPWMGIEGNSLIFCNVPTLASSAGPRFGGAQDILYVAPYPEEKNF